MTDKDMEDIEAYIDELMAKLDLEDVRRAAWRMRKMVVLTPPAWRPQ